MSASRGREQLPIPGYAKNTNLEATRPIALADEFMNHEAGTVPSRCTNRGGSVVLSLLKTKNGIHKYEYKYNEPHPLQIAVGPRPGQSSHRDSCSDTHILKISSIKILFLYK